jgi:dienelactone hydrolase
MPASSFSLSVFLIGLLAIGSVGAANPPSDIAPGDRMLDAYMRHQTQQIADACLADIRTRADWEKKRPELRRQFLDMIGLWPPRPRTDLQPVITGKLDSQHFTVEKLHFQSSPGLYVTANLYVPKRLTAPAPAILYVCGHANTVLDKVSYGSKVNYQHHPAWFAEHGYVCLILDTLELGEIPGIHHGTYRMGMWWWQARGYTPAGVECWNAIRAIDYLQSRKEVDPKRIGVTGRSGGGATSWWLAAADDRVQCIVPVAGIADLHAHLVEGAVPRFQHGVISGHCDCMYMVNTYRWDFPLVAALCVPRPLMLGNSTADEIFPVAGYRRLADKVRRIYDLYGARDRFIVVETAGPHKDTPELRLEAYRWMNRWLKGETGLVIEQERPRFTPQQLKVFAQLPEDALNPTIQETFVKPADPELPTVPEVGREWWVGQGRAWRRDLQESVFRGWPDKPPALNAHLAADITQRDDRLRAYDFTSEADVQLRLWLLTPAKAVRISRVIVTVLGDESQWQMWKSELGPAFRQAFPPSAGSAKGTRDRRALDWALDALAARNEPTAFVVLAPRGIGPTRWGPLDPAYRGGDRAKAEAGETQIRRRFALLGQTLDGQRVWDVRRALAVLRGLPDLKGTQLRLQGKAETAGIALYAALFEPDVAGLDLWYPPASHRQGPIFLNVRRFFDMPQALALTLPRDLRLYVKDEANARAWDWPVRLQQMLGRGSLKIRVIGD